MASWFILIHTISQTCKLWVQISPMSADLHAASLLLKITWPILLTHVPQTGPKTKNFFNPFYFVVCQMFVSNMLNVLMNAKSSWLMLMVFWININALSLNILLQATFLLWEKVCTLLILAVMTSHIHSLMHKVSEWLREC